MAPSGLEEARPRSRWKKCVSLLTREWLRFPPGSAGWKGLGEASSCMSLIAGLTWDNCEHLIAQKLLHRVNGTALACISFDSPDQPIYDCMGRIITTGVTTSHTTVEATSITMTKMHPSNQTDHVSFSSRSRNKMSFSHDVLKNKNHGWCLFYAGRTWTDVPFWYSLLRWGLFLSLPIILWAVIKC